MQQFYKTSRALMAVPLSAFLVGLPLSSGLAATRAKPRAVTITRQPGDLVGTTGETLSLRGTVRNGLQRKVWLSGSRVQLSGRALRVDSDGVLQTAPLALAAGRTTPSLVLSSLSVRLDADPGIYHGVLTLLGGKRRGDQDVLSQINFQVTVK